MSPSCFCLQLIIVSLTIKSNDLADDLRKTTDGNRNDSRETASRVDRDRVIEFET